MLVSLPLLLLLPFSTARPAGATAKVGEALMTQGAAEVAKAQPEPEARFNVEIVGEKLNGGFIKQYGEAERDWAQSLVDAALEVVDLHNFVLCYNSGFYICTRGSGAESMAYMTSDEVKKLKARLPRNVVVKAQKTISATNEYTVDKEGMVVDITA